MIYDYSESFELDNNMVINLGVSSEENSTGSPVNCYDDSLDCNSEHSYEHHFEGIEKTLEVTFQTTGSSASNGLRRLTKEQLDGLCSEAKCSILSKITNSAFDAYVLSESSLFVYETSLIMKTCGTTTPLRCLNLLIEFSKSLGLELITVRYFRKNLILPANQAWPHCSFDDEVQYLNSISALTKSQFKISSYVQGPISENDDDSDRYYTYIAHKQQQGGIVSSVNNTPNHDRVLLSMMLFSLDETTMRTFYRAECGADEGSHGQVVGRLMTHKSGIPALLHEDAIIDEFAFSPCGYSMNAIHEDAYYTVHITPEPSCSYVSYETNAPVADHAALIAQVLQTFKPRKVVVTLFADEGVLMDGVQLAAVTAKRLAVEGTGAVFDRTALSLASMDGHKSCLMASYSIAA